MKHLATIDGGVIRLETTSSGRRRKVPLDDDSYRALVSLGQKAEGQMFKTRFIKSAYDNAVVVTKLDDVNFHTRRVVGQFESGRTG